MTAFAESTVEEGSLAWLETAGWQVARESDIAPDTPVADHRDAGDHALADARVPRLRGTWQ